MDAKVRANYRSSKREEQVSAKVRAAKVQTPGSAARAPVGLAVAKWGRESVGCTGCACPAFAVPVG